MQQTIFTSEDSYSLKLDGTQQCNDLLSISNIDEETARKLNYAMQLVFEEHKLIRAFNIGKESENQNVELELPEGFENVKIPSKLQEPIRVALTFTRKPTESYLGGTKPNNLELPNAGVVSFQYLGHLGKSEMIKLGFDFELPLVFPIYSNVEKVFLDISSPLQPQIINWEEVENASTSHGEYINKDTWMNYSMQQVEFQFSDHSFFPKLLNEFTTRAGIPYWKQTPYIPHCPKTGKRMDFVMQLDSKMTEFIKVSKSNVPLKGREWRKSEENVRGNSGTVYYSEQNTAELIYNQMNFWGDGTLYIFASAESKTVCMFIQ